METQDKIEKWKTATSKTIRRNKTLLDSFLLDAVCKVYDHTAFVKKKKKAGKIRVISLCLFTGDIRVQFSCSDVSNSL